MQIIININNLSGAESLFPEAIELIPPIIESAVTNNPDYFYQVISGVIPSEILQEMPEDGDLDDVYYDRQKARIINYDIHCNICESASEIMRSSIMMAYGQTNIHKMLKDNEAVGVKRLNNHSVILRLEPR